MGVMINVDPNHSPEATVNVPIEDWSTMTDRNEDIKGALVEAVQAIARVYELDVEIH